MGESDSLVTPRQRLTTTQVVFLASLLGLFLELALIRWVSCEIRVFAYLKNLVLMASFLGFGSGCLMSKRRPLVIPALVVLLLLCMLVRLPWSSLTQFGPRRISAALSDLSGFMMFWNWDKEQAFGLVNGLLFATGWTTALFFAVAFVMVPFGQLTAAGIAGLPSPLRAYSVNLVGSLAGILLFAGASRVGLPPLLWIVPVVLGLLLLLPDKGEFRIALLLTAAFILVLLPNDSPRSEEIWSPYQKLEVIDRALIQVNNVGYQRMIEQLPAPGAPSPEASRWTLPYRLGRTPQHVLILGAGSGNDAAAALSMGVPSVVAVDIDPFIFAIGEDLHPDRPYSDSRVRRVVDDARHFLRTTDEKFDLIVLSHLDSHTVLSSFTNVRLDDYIYTVESLADARRVLTADGMLFLSFWAQEPFIYERLFRNVTLAFGHEPVALRQTYDFPKRDQLTPVMLLASTPEAQPGLLEAAIKHRIVVPLSIQTSVRPSTDAWPFLSLRAPSIPTAMVPVSVAILLLSALLAWKVRPPGDRVDWRLFFMGAAFMLVETHNVSRLALVFGVTWNVNAWVVGAILGVIVLANVVSERLQRLGRGASRAMWIGLLVSLALAFVVPLGSLSALPGGDIAAVALLTLPVFFAGLVFANAFASSPSPAFALGWNVLGSVLGGLAESLSYVIGIPGLVLIAAGFYLLAWLLPTRVRT